MLSITLLARTVQDTVIVAPGEDATGIFGPIIDYWFLPIIAFLQSAVLKGFELAGPAWAKVSEPVKWTVLYLVGLALTWLSGQLGFNATIDGVQLTDAAVISAIPTVVAGLIFKFGRHHVPVTGTGSIR